jgi:hypothetical protein
MEAVHFPETSVNLYRLHSALKTDCNELQWHHAMKPYWVLETELHVFLTSALDGGE